MFISFIIVNWNAKKYLKNCFESILNDSSDFDYEVIIVDNHSDDDSISYIKNNFPQFTIIQNNDNLGFSQANNIGISYSTGRYVCLINPDTKVISGCISELVSYLEKNVQIGLIAPKLINADGSLQRSCMGFPTCWNQFCTTFALDKIFPNIKWISSYMMRYWKHDCISEVDIINGAFWLIRRESLSDVGLLDENFFMYGEDMDFCKRFHANKWKIVFYPNVFTIHYGAGSSSQKPIRFYIEMKRANLQYWKKYHTKYSLIIFFILNIIHQLVRLISYRVLTAFKQNDYINKYKYIRNKNCFLWLLQSNLNFKKAISNKYFIQDDMHEKY